MRVLLVEPLNHPVIIDIEDSLEVLRVHLNCDYIECVYPFEEDIVLICDDCGAISGRQIPNRKVNRHIIFGPFIICGTKKDKFSSLDEETLNKYKDLFYNPEIFKIVDGEIKVIKMISSNEA